MFSFLRKPFLIFLMFIAFRAISQINPVIPAWVKNEDITKVGNINTKDIKDGYYYLLVEEEHNAISKQSFYRYAMKIVGEAGLSSASQIEVVYDPAYEKVELHSIIIHRGGQQINRLTKSEIKVLDQENQRSNGILEGTKTIYCNLSDLRIGDVVEYAYSIKGHNKIFEDHYSYNLWLGYSVPVALIKQSVIVPLNQTPVYRNYNHNIVPQIVHGQHSEYTWIAKNPAIPKLADNTPEWHNAYATTEVSDYQSWGEVKSLCLRLFDVGKYDTKLFNEVRDSILASNPGNKLKQISAAVDFVQKQIRYSGNENGIYSHVPHKPDFVLKHRYGDCKDKAFLLTELLKSMDVKAWPVLVNTRLGNKVEQHIPSHYRFNHCIAGIEHEGVLHFIDGTITTQKGAFTERKTPDYQMGLVLNTDSSFLFADFKPDELSRIDAKEVFDVDENGDAVLEANFTYTGIRADEMRDAFASNSFNDLQENFRVFYKKYADVVEVLDSVKYIDSDESNVFTTIERYRLKKFWKAGEGENKNTISKDFAPYSLNEKIIFVSDETRKEPLALNFPLKFNYVIEVNRQGGWNIEDATKVRNNLFFTYHFKNTVSGNRLRLEYSYTGKCATVDSVDYPAYKEEAKFLDNNLIFSTSQTLTDEKVHSFNWLYMATQSLGLILSFFICLYFSKKTFNYTYISSYNSIQGPLILLAIGLCLTPVVLLINNISGLTDSYKVDFYALYLDSSISTYNPIKGLIIIAETFCNMLMLMMSIFIIPLFFQRRNSFRLYYAFYRIFYAAFVIADSIVVANYFEESSGTNFKTGMTTSEFIKLLLPIAVWVPYVWFSERSRGTFTVGNVFEGGSAETPPNLN